MRPPDIPQIVDAFMVGEVFPFHLVFDREMVIRQIGPSLSTLLPDLATGDRLDARFTILRPPVAMSFEEVAHNLSSLFLLESRTGCTLRGQMARCSDVHLAFICTPVVRSMSHLRRLGLGSEHFALHDSTLEHVLLQQATHNLVAEAERANASLQDERRSLQKAHAELQRINSRLSAANRLQSQFIAATSHELRSPLHTIQACLELLQQWQDKLAPDKQQQILGTAGAATEHLLHLVDDLIDSAALEAHCLTLNLVSVKGDSIVRRVVDMAETASGQRDVGIDFVGGGANTTVHVDEARVVRLLLNLIANAVNASAPGDRVTVATRIEDDTYAVSISDTGCGIAPEHLQRVFQKFVSVDHPGRRQQGLGLGLYLAQQIATLHRGHITVVSTVGQGSIFTLLLPLRPAPRPST